MSNLKYDSRQDAPHRKCKYCGCFCDISDLYNSPVQCCCLNCYGKHNNTYTIPDEVCFLCKETIKENNLKCYVLNKRCCHKCVNKYFN